MTSKLNQTRLFSHEALESINLNTVQYVLRTYGDALFACINEMNKTAITLSTTVVTLNSTLRPALNGSQ